FRQALDRLAEFLVRWFGVEWEGYGRVVQPPCNYPMGVQRAVMTAGEVVQKMQAWDSGQEFTRPLDPLAPELVTALEEAQALLRPSNPTAGPPGLNLPGPANSGAGPGAKLTAVETAIEIFLRDPNQSIRQVAEQVPCAASTLSRSKKFRRLLRAHAAAPRKGWKTKEGDLEAAD